jgi:hypothetical protein
MAMHVMMQKLFINCVMICLAASSFVCRPEKKGGNDKERKYTLEQISS